MSPDQYYPTASGGQSRTRGMSHRELNLTMKAITSREVRESSKAASRAVAARLKGQDGERSNRVARAHGREKKRAIQLRTTRREAIYGDAVKQANMRGRNGYWKGKLKNKGSGPAREGRSTNVREDSEDLQYAQEHGGWKILSDAQAAEAKMEEEASREAAPRSRTFNAAFLESQEKARKRVEMEAARENVADGLRLAEDAEESLRIERKKMVEGRKASRILRESRRAQVAEKAEARLLARASEIQEELLEVEKIRALDRAEAWDKVQARRAARDKNRLNKEENRRLISIKAAEREENLREERRAQAEYAERMDAEEEKKNAEMRRVQERQTRINERMSKIYDLCKAQKDSVEKRVDEEQRMETETHERRAQEKEMKRLQLLQDQSRTLQEQEQRLIRRLAEERRQGVADAEDMKRRNREACWKEKAEKEVKRAEALSIQRFLEAQVAGKARARALEQASGGLTEVERRLNRTLLGQAAIMVRLAAARRHGIRTNKN